MKYILLIGAGSDIGRPLAFLYAKQGYGIYLASRNLDKLERDAADLMIRFGIIAQAYYLDVTDISTHGDFYQSLPERPYGIICLAGLLGDQSIAENDFTAASQILTTNFIGCVSILNIVAADLEQRREGFIVGVSSVAGERGRKSNYIYASAKAGFTTYLSGLRNRLYRSRVCVLTVHPGFIRTKMIEGKSTPNLITATPETVARDIFTAEEAKKDFIYSKWFWRYIMMAFRMIPESVVKKLNLK